MFYLNGRPPVGIHVKPTVSRIRYAYPKHVGFFHVLRRREIHTHHLSGKVLKLFQNRLCIFLYGYFNRQIESLNQCVEQGVNDYFINLVETSFQPRLTPKRIDELLDEEILVWRVLAIIQCCCHLVVLC